MSAESRHHGRSHGSEMHDVQRQGRTRDRRVQVMQRNGIKTEAEGDMTLQQAHAMTEAELKSVILSMAKAKGWIVYTTPQVKPMRPARLDGSAGYPDLTLARDGEVMWIELKQEDAKLSLPQAGWQLALPRMFVIRPSDLGSGRVEELLA